MFSDRSGETVIVMLNTGTNVNVSDNKNKSTPLHLAVNQGNDAGVKALLASRHCDVNSQVLDGRTGSGKMLETPLYLFAVAIFQAEG